PLPKGEGTWPKRCSKVCQFIRTFYNRPYNSRTSRMQEVVLLFLSLNIATIANGKCASKPPQFSGIVARAEKKLHSLKRLIQTKKVDMAGCGTLYLDRNRGGEFSLSGSTCDGSPSQLFRSSLQSHFTKRVHRSFRLDFSRQSPEG